MDQATAEHLASLVGGEAWQSGGGMYCVTVARDDGSLVVFSGDAVSEYPDDAAFDQARSSKTILLQILAPDDLYVLVDTEGNVVYRDRSLERGWLHEEEARHEAHGLESRGEGRFLVVRQRELA